METQTKSHSFLITCTDDKFWNLPQLIQFLSGHQGQCIKLTINPEAVDFRSLGLYDILDCFDFQSVTIVTQNPFENHDKYKIVYIKGSGWFSTKVDDAESCHGWTQDKVFLTYYGRPTANRLALCSHLFEFHKEKSLLHFSAAMDDDSVQLFEMDKMFQCYPQSMTNVSKMLNHMPLLIESSEGYSDVSFSYKDPLNLQYKNILIDIVSEAHVKGLTFYPTEKTSRPMWYKKPFIVFASRDYLDYMHQLGFKTFCDFWSEEYDGYEERDRYIKITQLIDDLAQKSQQELTKMYADMQEILDHNYDLLANRSYNFANIKRII